MNNPMPDTDAPIDDWGVWSEKRDMERGKGVKVIPISDKYRDNWDKIFKDGEKKDDKGRKA